MEKAKSIDYLDCQIGILDLTTGRFLSCMPLLPTLEGIILKKKSDVTASLQGSVIFTPVPWAVLGSLEFMAVTLLSFERQ